MRIYLKYLFYLLIGIGVSSANAGAYDDFFKAVIRDDVAWLRSLLQQGVDPNSRDPKGYPALTLALRRESPGAFALLLELSLIHISEPTRPY